MNRSWVSRLAQFVYKAINLQVRQGELVEIPRMYIGIKYQQQIRLNLDCDNLLSPACLFGSNLASKGLEITTASALLMAIMEGRSKRLNCFLQACWNHHEAGGHACGRAGEGGDDDDGLGKWWVRGFSFCNERAACLFHQVNLATKFSVAPWPSSWPLILHLRRLGRN